MDKVKRDGASHTDEVQVPPRTAGRGAAAGGMLDERRARPVVSLPVGSNIMKGPGQDEDEITRRTGLPGAGGFAVASVRLSPGGVVTAGEAPEALVESLAYAAQMADIVGDLLGVEGFVWMEVARSTGPCVVARQANGDLTSMSSGHGVDAATLKRMMGL